MLDFFSKAGLSSSMYNKSFVSFSVVFTFWIKATHITAVPVHSLQTDLTAFISAVANVTSRQALKSERGKGREQHNSLTVQHPGNVFANHHF